MSYYDKICLTNTVLIFPLILIAYFNTAFRPRANKYQSGANTDKFTSGFNPSCILHRPKMSSGSEKVIAEIPVNEDGILCLSGQEAKVILENVSRSNIHLDYIYEDPSNDADKQSGDATKRT